MRVDTCSTAAVPASSRCAMMRRRCTRSTDPVPAGAAEHSRRSFAAGVPVRDRLRPSARATLLRVGGGLVMTDRRAFLVGLAAVGTLKIPGAGATPSSLRVNAGRLQRTLEDLSVFGRPADGSFADGVNR